MIRAITSGAAQLASSLRGEHRFPCTIPVDHPKFHGTGLNTRVGSGDLHMSFSSISLDTGLV